MNSIVLGRHLLNKYTDSQVDRYDEWKTAIPTDGNEMKLLERVGARYEF